MNISLKQAYTAFAVIILIGYPAAGAYAYQPPAQVVITDAESHVGTITTREHFFSTPKIEKVYIAHRPYYDNMLFCKQAGYPSVQYHCRSTYYNQSAHFDRTAVGKTQNVELAWNESLTIDHWDQLPHGLARLATGTSHHTGAGFYFLLDTFQATHLSHVNYTECAG